MRAFYRANGDVRFEFKRAASVNFEVDRFGRHLVVPKDEFEELADQIKNGDPVRAELERDLDEARRRIEQLTEERDRMTTQRDEAVRKAAVVDALRPIRMTVPAELLTESDDKELRAVIVSQAREIARLKGESE
ncbi:hypothetical protein AB0E81_11350 [Streptomyces sp. NPDC033538]|uniref:hypothetical protein n=1 Tax=Streptomyces sp. NPDC033538 TaxID=3155367 RepID=UPI0033C4142F